VSAFLHTPGTTAADRALLLGRAVAAAAQQHVDQRHREGDLADAECGAEVDRPECQGGEDADEEARGEGEQLTGHRSEV
jgi:hypothetical protein